MLPLLFPIPRINNNKCSLYEYQICIPYNTLTKAKRFVKDLTVGLFDGSSNGFGGGGCQFEYY